MGASLSGVFSLQEFTDLGALAAGYRLYTYAPSTTTLKAAYTDAAGLVPHTYTSDGSGGQYIGLNSRGELPAPLFLTSGGYDITLKTAAGATVWTRLAIGTDDSSAAVLTDLANRASASKGAALVAYDYANSYASYTVGRALTTSKNLLLDGTIDSTGVTPCAAALNVLIAGGGDWTLPPGTYLIDASIVVPDGLILRCMTGAVFKPAANGLTLFTTKNYSGTQHAYFSRIENPYFDANSKTGVVCFDMKGFRHAAAITFPKFIGAFDHCIKLTELCWDTIIEMPFAQGCVNGILVAHGSNAVQIRKPGIDGLGSTGYGIKIIGGAAYTTTSNRVIGGYVQGFSGAGGVGCWDSGLGTTYGVYGNSFEGVYFENNAFADIYFDTSYYGRAVRCEHYVTSGQNANYGRNNVGVRVEAPLMTSGARSIGLYNFDTSNRNCFGDQTTDVTSGINIPLGTVSGIGLIPTAGDGTFTPIVRGSSTAGTGATIDAASKCTWVSNGKSVTLKGYVKWSGLIGAVGNLNIQGAPVALTPSGYVPTGIGNVIALQTWTNQDMVCSLSGTGTTIQFLQVSTAGSFTPLAVTGAGEIYFDLTYTL